jgi:hypothetical protein
MIRPRLNGTIPKQHVIAFPQSTDDPIIIDHLYDQGDERMLTFKRQVSLVMAVLMLLIYAPLPSAVAAMIATDEAAGAASAAEQRIKVRAFLQRADFVRILEAQGIDPAEAAKRTDSLTAGEIDQLAHKIDQLPAGGDLFGTLALIAVIFFLVLILLELTGFIDVFTFINSPRR